ncbi:MAG TPA: MopE-related protein [Polyangiaceae bacterium LLY-WYZ-15_(1-7)]|nr:hypothetical protein [Myxococcales bacterium]MAT23814.1 hypothetical protein [Sandaracinus sp.]HJL06331.1 MopE-related protein [Polyangiaceae bacterium LLY-WYZ-15_(1-7)]HJL10774.1 MopE-related protein [Polyangiaceae bacterium LLY-WYZ-15_(1-7)]HJL24447.1 MopE-related protein [Polyangiaceae bacterium LLY-WYZ-15_(1-7)]
MRRSNWKRAWRGALHRLSTIITVLAIVSLATTARGDGVANVLTSKSLPPATVAVIDPESGTSGGTGGGAVGDVRLTAGDIILFRMNLFPVPNGQIHGLNGWLTEYIPPNTEVVGVRFIDPDGNTILPRQPGIASDDCGRTCNGFNSVPSSGGTRNLDDGSIAQLYADTGIFYSTDARTERVPNDRFILLSDGIEMTVEPQRVGDVDGPIGAASPFYAHNLWDWIQVRSFGISNPDGNVSGNNGTGNTPFDYGSPVAGPLTHYSLEVVEPSAGTLYFDDDVGPWQRIQYPGSLIGSGTGIAPTDDITRVTVDASTLGFDVTPASPLPAGTNAVRFALGETRVGEPVSVEIALRVVGTPIDDVQMANVNCAEAIGGDTSARSGTTRGDDNMWPIYLGSPACVFLNLLFDLESDRPLAVGGDTVTFTLRTRNLSTATETGAVVRQKFDGSRIAYLGVVAGTPAPTLVTNCDGDGLDCLVWPARDYAPSEETVYETQFSPGGGGQVTHRMRADFNSADTSFETQELNLIRPIGVLGATLASATPSASPGGTADFTGTLDITGTSTVSVDEVVPVLPSGWTITDSNGSGDPDITIGGVVVECSADCATNRPEFNYATALAAPVSQVVEFTANVPGGTPTGLYDVDLQVWASQTGFGGRYETWFENIATQAVGAPRSTPPELECPVLSPWTTIPGTTTEADGTVIRVFFNLIERGDDTAAGGTFDVPFPGFGGLYGGLEVRATAQAPGELESELSDPCFVTQVPVCSDGLDNDGDGAIDFPADPGCASAGDGDETDVACSDGADNDGDGLVDFPDDPECASPNDTSEGGPPACADGIDNDGDGLTDVADPDCVDASDRTEKSFALCANGLDDDGDGFIDFPDDPGCHSELDDVEIDPLDTEGDVRARLLFVFDSSGSMNWNTCADDFTGGDGTLECPGDDLACAGGCAPSGCGDGEPNDSRLAKAKSGLSQVVAGFGEVEYGLMRFHQRAMEFACPTSNASAQSGGWQGAGAAPCGGGFDEADLLVGFSQENQPDLLAWMDGDSESPTGMPAAGCDFEIRGTGTTPLAGSLASAETYLDDVQTGDTAAACRPYVVILITDGVETCGGDPVSAASSLSAAGYTTYVVGFAVEDPTARASLDAIAAAGGGRPTAIYVSDETELATSISDIIDDTVLVEVCNDADDDCDGLTDEGVTNACGSCGPVPVEVCDDFDDDCDGVVDEGTLNACGECGPTPTESCNAFDDDCDGAIDEGGVCPCAAPEPETCDDFDNDCDGFTDEGLTRVCGTDVGACSVGSETCSMGTWAGCDAVGPSAESCNGIDDDCDGVVDGLTRPCGETEGICEAGVEFCRDGAFDGVCVGAVEPGTELCNTLDDDCDGRTDEGTDPDTVCGSDLGACSPGRLRCVGGTLSCEGGTGPAAESCNSIDDDCDGTTDESVPTDGPCGETEGECAAGVRTCVAGSFTCVGAVGPRTEICDGVDNDCDASTDEGDPGGGAACGTDEGACSPGTTLCDGGRIVCDGDTGPVAELCNTVDDDCDGLIDESNPEGGTACGDTDVGECAFGAEVCRMGTLECVGATGPSAEICDGLDNDCDGRTDEDNPEGGMACGDDTGECSPGTTLCTGGELICDGAVGPTEEVCNGLDDDCDGVADDGLDVGAPCGSDTGECVPGVRACVDGAIVCEGELGPIPEECDALDNDCDGAVDEELAAGETCGDTEGVCMPGMIQCVDGAEICVGGVPAAPETCDCEDNDCDGAIDEDPDSGAICPGESACVDCQCALPCSTSEFGTCPTGRVEVEIEGECYCVAPRCNPETCGEETVERDGVVRCAPDEEGVPVCECIANECTFPCDGVVCEAPTVCNPGTGRCVVDDCTGLGCPAGELCEVRTGDCIPDPCLDVECAADEACRDGVCETSCGSVSCDPGDRCTGGECVDDLCEGVGCPSDQRCDEESGECVDDLCFMVTCPEGTVCNPETGGCGEDPCLRLRCPESDRCFEGECVPRPMMTDAGPMDMDAGPTEADAGPGEEEEDPEDRVLAAGGGGCTCRIVGPDDDGPPPLGWLALLVPAVLVWRRRNGGTR